MFFPHPSFLILIPKNYVFPHPSFLILIPQNYVFPTISGSALVSLRLIKHPSGPENAHKVPITYDIPESLIPKPALYTFRLFMFSGSDFGSRGPQQSGKGLMH